LRDEEPLATRSINDCYCPAAVLFSIAEQYFREAVPIA
jgi:hypothetical protein